MQKPYNRFSLEGTEEEDEKLKSRINTAGLINSTLENLWKDCYSAMSKGDLVLWNRKLDAIWLILGGDCVPGDNDDKEMERINKLLYKTGKLHHKASGFGKLNEDEGCSMSLQYLYLQQKSLFLRRLQNHQGKGTAYVSSDEDDFD